MIYHDLSPSNIIYRHVSTPSSIHVYHRQSRSIIINNYLSTYHHLSSCLIIDNHNRNKRKLNIRSYYKQTQQTRKSPRLNKHGTSNSFSFRRNGPKENEFDVPCLLSLGLLWYFEFILF